MKISIIGNIPEQDKDSYINMIDVFVKDHKVGTPVILTSGDIGTLSAVDKYAKSKGYDCVIMGNATQLAVFNATKVILVWNGKDSRYLGVASLCQKERVPFTEIMTK